MIRLVGKKLIIPRGDTGSFSIPALASYDEGDAAIFSIIDTKTNKNIMQKKCIYNNNSFTVEFQHNETVNKPVGKYYWDIKFYKNAKIVDNEIVDGIEVNSYYAAYQLPVCEIRQTGDKLLTIDEQEKALVLNNEGFNLLNGVLNQVQEMHRKILQYKEELEYMLHTQQRLTQVENITQSLSSDVSSLQEQATNLSNNIETLSNNINLLQDTISNLCKNRCVMRRLLTRGRGEATVPVINSTGITFNGQYMILDAAGNNVGTLQKYNVTYEWPNIPIPELVTINPMNSIRYNPNTEQIELFGAEVGYKIGQWNIQTKTGFLYDCETVQE